MSAILSDDPRAIEKLTAKLKALEDYQQHMKDINAGYKEFGKEWVRERIPAETYNFYIRETLYNANAGKFFPGWALNNNAANIRATRKRLELLKKKKEREASNE